MASEDSVADLPWIDWNSRIYHWSKRIFARVRCINVSATNTLYNTDNILDRESPGIQSMRLHVPDTATPYTSVSIIHRAIERSNLYLSGMLLYYKHLAHLLWGRPIQTNNFAPDYFTINCCLNALHIFTALFFRIYPEVIKCSWEILARGLLFDMAMP